MFLHVLAANQELITGLHNKEVSANHNVQTLRPWLLTLQDHIITATGHLKLCQSLTLWVITENQVQLYKIQAHNALYW